MLTCGDNNYYYCIGVCLIDPQRAKMCNEQTKMSLKLALRELIPTKNKNENKSNTNATPELVGATEFQLISNGNDANLVAIKVANS